LLGFVGGAVEIGFGAEMALEAVMGFKGGGGGGLGGAILELDFLVDIVVAGGAPLVVFVGPLVAPFVIEACLLNSKSS